LALQIIILLMCFLNPVKKFRRDLTHTTLTVYIIIRPSLGAALRVVHSLSVRPSVYHSIHPSRACLWFSRNRKAAET